jgi:hypothetical protein
MECSKRGEGHDYPSQPWSPADKSEQRLMPGSPAPEASAEELSAGENSDTSAIPGYLTLELDVSDLPAFMPETGVASMQPDWEMSGRQDPEGARPDFPECLEPEEPALPGYLTLEIDLNALGDHAPWRSSNNATSDEPGGKM